MKKSIVFIFGALLALGACTKTVEIPEGTSDSKALKFRLAVNTPTKGDVAYKGNKANELNQNVVFASVRKDNGEIQKSYFYNGDPAYGSFSYDDGESKWSLMDPSGKEVKYLPNGSLMDMVVLGRYKDSFDMGSNYYLSSSATDYSEYMDAIDHGFPYMKERKWTPYVFENSKSIDGKVYFIGVDTYKDQVDVVYSVKNSIAADGTTHTITLKHAQALININVQFLSAVPDLDHMCLAFIGPNTPFNSTSYSDYSTMKDFILGYDQVSCKLEDVMSAFMNAAESANLANYYDDYLPLKTVGSFLIDNSLNTPVVGWKFPKLSESDTWANLKEYNDGLAHYDDGGYAVLSNKEKTYSEFNSSISDCFADPMNLLDGLESGGSSFATSTYYQAAGQLIPEQKIVNPWIYFTIDNKTYLTEVNLPKGVWQAGHVYTYNLTLSFNGLNFKVEVENYESSIESLVSTL